MVSLENKPAVASEAQPSWKCGAGREQLEHLPEAELLWWILVASSPMTWRTQTCRRNRS